ncbi:beta-lactamase/transpeptidase-like protein [Lasiosphaeris hirsuta]|uniref:Beta-lactamase/transpeptidase-like protein n=1 Tax=Lasiosphaeris hirsuta TaxID=260670 RepID=A0AA39ZXK0_9PEZI|nr:beta-lactamase/transpeptidase-like protein [Lasiosphaeris hirsuta]
MSSSWEAFEARVQKAVDDGVLPGAVMLARDKTGMYPALLSSVYLTPHRLGKLNYAAALGQASLDPPRPMRTDTMFALASMTKLLTILAALHLVDRGLLTLDTDVTTLLPALAAKPILTSLTTTAPRETPILLRHLLTHSSGCGYGFLDPLLGEYNKARNAPPPHAVPTTTVAARFHEPLLFEPGAGWAYGASIDWVGQLVETVSGEPLDGYIQTHVLAPVGVTDPAAVTFYPERHGGETCSPARRAQMTTRDTATGRVVAAPLPPPEADPGRGAMGGEGVWADLSAYLEVLYSLLLDDGRVLGSETARWLFEPQLEPRAKEALLAGVKDAKWIVGHVPDTGEYDWSLGGLLVDGDSHGHRNRGFLTWAGVFNVWWFIDRTAGVCGVFGTQILVPADPLVEPLLKEFEEEIYAKL